MKLKLNSVIQPIFLSKDGAYLFRNNNDFYEIDFNDIIHFVISFLNQHSEIEQKLLQEKLETLYNIDKENSLQIINDLIDINIITKVTNNDRYSTNRLYFSLFDNKSKEKYQDILSNSVICVLGLGGSTMIIQQLAQLGVKKIIGVDYDSLEAKNLNRQVLTKESDIGSLKVNVLEKNVKEINSRIEYDFKNIYIDSAEKVSPLILDADIVILALDEPMIDSSMWVHQACKDSKKKLISGGVWGDQLTYMWFDYGNPYTPCYQCMLEQSLEQSEVILQHTKQIKGKSFSDFNTTISFNGSILSGIMVCEIVKILTNYSAEIPPGTIFQLNTTTWATTTDILEQIPECSFCMNNEFEYFNHI